LKNHAHILGAIAEVQTELASLADFPFWFISFGK
jgi:hypothetical protein